MLSCQGMISKVPLSCLDVDFSVLLSYIGMDYNVLSCVGMDHSVLLPCLVMDSCQAVISGG